MLYIMDVLRMSQKCSLQFFLSIYNTPCNHICSYWYYPICFDDQWYRWFGTITYGYIKRFIYPLHRWYLQNKAYFKLIKSWIMFLTFWPFEGCGMCSYEKKKLRRRSSFLFQAVFFYCTQMSWTEIVEARVPIWWR